MRQSRKKGRYAVNVRANLGHLEVEAVFNDVKQAAKHPTPNGGPLATLRERPQRHLVVHSETSPIACRSTKRGK